MSPSKFRMKSGASFQKEGKHSLRQRKGGSSPRYALLRCPLSPQAPSSSFYRRHESDELALKARHFRLSPFSEPPASGLRLLTYLSSEEGAEVTLGCCFCPVCSVDEGRKWPTPTRDISACHLHLMRHFTELAPVRGRAVRHLIWG